MHNISYHFEMSVVLEKCCKFLEIIWLVRCGTSSDVLSPREPPNTFNDS